MLAHLYWLKQSRLLSDLHSVSIHNLLLIRSVYRFCYTNLSWISNISPYRFMAPIFLYLYSLSIHRLPSRMLLTKRLVFGLLVCSPCSLRRSNRLLRRSGPGNKLKWYFSHHSSASGRELKNGLTARPLFVFSPQNGMLAPTIKSFTSVNAGLSTWAYFIILT